MRSPGWPRAPSCRERRLNITLYQTGDPTIQYEVLRATGRTARAFCRNNGLRYECFVGVRWGSQNWHSTFNRIVYLTDRVREGYAGWIICLDPDSFVQDLHFNVGEYLADKAGFAMIGASAEGTAAFSDLNFGCVIYNLSRPFMHQLIGESFEYMTEAALEAGGASGARKLDGQGILQTVLARHPDMANQIHREDWRFMASPSASFLRTAAPVPGLSFAERAAYVSARTEEVMAYS